MRAGLLGQLRLGLGQQLFRLLAGFGGDLTGLLLHGAGDLGAGLLRGVGDLTGLLLRHIGRRGLVLSGRGAGWRGDRRFAVGRCPRP